MSKHFVEALARISAGDWREANSKVHGTVTDVDAAKQMVRLRVGGSDAEPFKSPWVPYSQVAGALKVHTPPSVGQQMTLLSPAGDWAQGYAVPLTFSDENASPSSQGNEHVLTFGSVRATVRGQQVLIEIGGAKLDMTGSKITLSVGGAQIEMTGDGIKATAQSFEHEGDVLSHNGHSVGDDHVHTGVTPGGSTTGPPP